MPEGISIEWNTNSLIQVLNSSPNTISYDKHYAKCVCVCVCVW